MSGDESQHSGGPERRRSQRVPLEAVVHYQVADSEFINLSSNISPEGIFIRNFAPPPVGTEIRIKVHLPPELGDAPLQLIGTVVRVADDVGAEQRGMGVEFSSIQADSPEAIRAFVREIYEIDKLEDFEDAEAQVRYKPGPYQVLRLEPAPPSGPIPLEPFEPAGRRLLWGLGLLLVGLLIGAGVVFLFFSLQ
ncbi:MAG: PilZ domain-containing protein [Deltaproteobacteria bacterium]|nr:PilZ domain-containing protein [Deltaproteobacteria bacterium]